MPLITEATKSIITVSAVRVWTTWEYHTKSTLQNATLLYQTLQNAILLPSKHCKMQRSRPSTGTTTALVNCVEKSWLWLCQLPPRSILQPMITESIGHSARSWLKDEKRGFLQLPHVKSSPYQPFSLVVWAKLSISRVFGKRCCQRLESIQGKREKGRGVPKNIIYRRKDNE